ncbi:MAG: MarR family transcriptional regulator [Nocardioidaceae bacterium]|nr:MarR family transcriptional regulator [Nocardioidaceae bacterium]
MTTTTTHDALISTFGRLVEAYNVLERPLGQILERDCGIPHSWFEVMLRLRRSEDTRMTMGELAEQITLTTGGVTRLIDRMQSAGYVERRPCPTDRRVSFATLTSAGLAKLEAAAEVHAKSLEDVFADFTRDELATFDQMLDRLRRSSTA